MFESRVTKRIFGSKGEEVTGRWGKVHSVELHNLYASLIYISTTLKSRRIR
jgi:hypothetical protein